MVERRVEIPTPTAPTRRDWGPLLAELAGQLKDGRVHDRDLAALATALGAVLDAPVADARTSGTGAATQAFSISGERPGQAGSGAPGLRVGVKTLRPPQPPVLLQWR